MSAGLAPYSWIFGPAVTSAIDVAGQRVIYGQVVENDSGAILGWARGFPTAELPLQLSKLTGQWGRASNWSTTPQPTSYQFGSFAIPLRPQPGLDDLKNFETGLIGS